jgi:hypothetical protein
VECDFNIVHDLEKSLTPNGGEIFSVIQAIFRAFRKGAGGGRRSLMLKVSQPHI